MNRIFALLLFISGSCWAESYPALLPMSKELLSAPGEVVEVRNMPEARSQGGLPVCYGIAAWYAYMQFQCKKNNSDCKNLDPAGIPSPVMLGALGVDKELHEKYGSVYKKVVPYSIGGGAGNALSELAGEDELYADSCFPMERLLQKFGSNRKMFNAFENLRVQYFDKNKAAGGICMNCLLDTLRNDFDLNAEQATAQKALDENVFDKFLFDLFVSGCHAKVAIGDFHVAGWPAMGEIRSYENFIKRLVALLRSNTPVLADICLDQKNVSAAQCKSGHAVVIAGYRNVCAGAKCTDYLKVLNTWGDAWQRQYSDGWVNGGVLYEHIDLDSGVDWLR